MKKGVKGFLIISDVLDDRYQKLSDRFHDLELSHNRKRKALQWLHDFFHGMKPQELYDSDLFYINKCIDNALFCDGKQICRMKGENDEKRS